MYSRALQLQKSATVRSLYCVPTWQPQQLNKRYFATRYSGEDSPKAQLIAPRRSSLWKAVKNLIILSALGGASIVAYDIYAYNNPPVQSPSDPNKKNLVVLGTGWGSTAFLKDIDASKYNVVVISPAKGVVHIKKETDGSCKDDVVEFDYLVHGVGSKTATFGIEGIEENACFMKEVEDAQKLRKLVMSRVEEASLKGQFEENIDRLLHMVVVGGGPTGVEVAAELQDYFKGDLQKLVPELKGKLKVTLIEALPTILPIFSKQLIEYAETTMKGESIDLLKSTMVKRATDTDLEVQFNGADGQKQTQKIPYGLLVWAGGNAPQPLTRDLMTQLPEQASSRRGLLVNEFLQVKGTGNIWALGDCTATSNAPTAQVANQQGAYLAKYLNARANVEEQLQSQQQVEIDDQMIKSEKFPTFKYDHKGSLAYVGNERAIADLSFWQMTFPSAGASTLFIWRAAYINMCISIRNRLFILARAGTGLGLLSLVGMRAISSSLTLATHEVFSCILQNSIAKVLSALR